MIYALVGQSLTLCAYAWLVATNWALACDRYRDWEYRLKAKLFSVKIKLLQRCE
jgi:hypothetical protein